MKTVFAIIGFVVVALVVGTCVACVHDDDDNGHSLGRIQLVGYHGDRDCYQYGDCRDHDRRYDNDGEDNRRAGISPGPFDRSPVDIHDNRLVVCFPFSRCDGKDDGNGQQPGETPR